MNIFRTVLTLAGGYFLLQQIGYAVAEQVQSRIEVWPVRAKFRFSWNTPSFLFLDITFQVQNQNQVGGTADGFEGDLFYNSTRLGNISLAGPISIPPSSSTTIEMTARISMEELPMEIARLITSGNFLGTLRVKGTLYTSYVNIPVDRNIPIA